MVVAAALSTLVAPGISSAAPAKGASAPEASVEDVDGKKLALSSLEGKTVVVVYEDKDSAKLNDAFKEGLKKLDLSSVAVLPVADVSEYNSWPAKGFVKDAIREESKKAGVTIYCDWDASFRKALELTKGTSCIVIFSKKGKVLFAHDGALSEDQQKAALSAVSKDG